VCEKDATGLCVALTLTQKLFLLLLFREEGCSLIYIRVTVIIIIIIIIIIMKVQSAKQPIVYKVPLNQNLIFTHVPRVKKYYSLTGRRNHGRPLKRLLDT